MKTVSLRLFLLITSIILVTIPAVVIGIYNTHESKIQINETHENELEDQLTLVKNQIGLTMDYTEQFVENNLRALEASLPDLTGESPDWKTADAILKRFSAISDTHYTVFLPGEGGIVRKITTIKNQDGQYAVGTKIETSSEVYKSVIGGKTYRGKALILDRWYSSVYMPVYDIWGDLSHILFAGIPESEFLDSLLDDLSKRVIGEDGYFFILSPQGDYILSKDRERDGENILGARDNDGRYFVKEMIENSMERDYVSLIQYPWQNSGENEVRSKVSAYAYIEELQWILGSSDYRERALALVAQTRRMLLITIAVAILAGVGVSLFLTQLIYSSFSRLQSNIGSVARGNLKDQDGRGSFFSEIDDLQHSMHDHMIPKLKGLLGSMEQKSGQISQMSEVLGYNISQTLRSIDKVNNSCGKVSRESVTLTSLMAESRKSTEAIAASVEEYQDMMHVQNESVAEISASIEETGASLNNVTRVVSDKLDAALDLSRQGEEGRKSVDLTNDLIVKTEEDVTGLLEILHIINDITDRTQLLAMNASIEAAHAGQEGRGFAIVAGEMRQLAESTSVNGKKIEDALGEITGRIRAASEHSAQTRNFITAMTGNLKEFTRAFKEIADSTQEISLGTSQILEAAGMLSELSEKNYRNSHRIKDSVEQLNSAVKNTETNALSNKKESENLKKCLKEVVNAQREMGTLGNVNRLFSKELTEELKNFVYDELAREESLLDMIRDHQRWVEKAESHLEGKSKLNPAELDNHTCSLGLWLENDSYKCIKDQNDLHQLREHHEQLHSLVKSIARSDGEDGESQIEHLKEHSHHIIHNLLASMQVEV